MGVTTFVDAFSFGLFPTNDIVDFGIPLEYFYYIVLI